MAHKEQRDFCEFVKHLFPNMFEKKIVLDCGSLDINGNNRYLFEKCSYTGIDIVAGKNVNVVNHVHKLDYYDNIFNVIISTEMLEHDKHYELSLKKMVQMLSLEGLLILTCGTTIGDIQRQEHGTINRLPECSPGTTDYYKNITEQDIREAIDIDEIFSNYEFIINTTTCDLYFWGVKKC